MNTILSSPSAPNYKIVDGIQNEIKIEKITQSNLSSIYIKTVDYLGLSRRQTSIFTSGIFSCCFITFPKMFYVKITKKKKKNSESKKYKI